MAFDLDLGLPHPRSRIDRCRRVGIHTRERIRVRRARAPGRIADRCIRSAAELLLQRPHRLLRRDRQAPRGASHLGALDEGSLRRPARTLDATAVPHPDRRRVTHRTAARGQHRPHRHRSPRRRARRHPVAAHQLDGRSTRPAHRKGRTHRVAYAAGDRPRNQRHPRRRPARRFVLRRRTHRRDGTPGRRDLRHSSTSSATAHCSTA